MSTGKIIALVGGGLLVLIAVLVVIALVIVFAVRAVSAGSGPTAEEQATSLVTDYMSALEGGEVATALELMPMSSSQDATELSEEAYAAALEAAPVADITVHEPVLDGEDPMDGSVTVDYTVGGEATSAEFSVADYDQDETWELVPSIATATLPATLNGLGVTLNGVELEDEARIRLLPGAYQAALSSSYFTLSSEDPLLITSSVPEVTWPEPMLNDDGLTAFRGAVQEAAELCLAQKTLEAGCGIGTLPSTSSDGWTMTDGTVERTMPEDTQRAIDTMEPTPSGDEPTYVQGDVVGSIDTTMECTKDGQTGICEMWLGGGMSIPNVDMADPELPVTWS
ncbi:hypothetical protein [Brachybacterium sp. P6-10-X1]|uniref:hypothetical protein n=1 Tax=Brachybacterium sp. P6-10-X1 TaxID=1903186 RepID=UPI0020A3BC55|nr:hypothetical protein [Brachybacterium sp. P6-10-X1]